MFMVETLVIFLIALYTLPSHSSPVDDLLRQELAKEKVMAPMLEVAPSGMSKYVPIQSMEYQHWLRESEDDSSQTLRFNLKSLREMTTASERSRWTHQLADTVRLRLMESERFYSYRRVVDQILTQRQTFLRIEQRDRLKRVLGSSSQALRLKDSSARQILSDLLAAQDLEVKIQPSGDPAQPLKPSQRKLNQAMADQLQGQTSQLMALLLTTPADPLTSPEIQAKDLTLRLAQRDQEVKEADDTKWFPYIDLRQNSKSNESSLRIGINIPFSRFDSDLQWQERVQLKNKQFQLDQETRRLAFQAQEDSLRLQAESTEIQSLLAQQAKILAIQATVSPAKHSEISSYLQQSRLQIENDLIVRTLKFYRAYLDYLKDQGLLTRRANTNFLDPQWSQL